MAENIVKEQLRKLIELQKIDSEIYSIKSDLEEKPLKLKRIKDEFDLEKQTLKTLEETLKQIQLSRKEKELELQTKEDAIGKCNSQLLQIKTNKEYTAKMNEIASIEADKTKIEEEVLVFYDESDKIRSEVEKENQIIAEKEKKYLDNKELIDSEISVLENSISGIESNRNRILPDIKPNYLSRYEMLLGNKKGLALVAVYSGSCGGCYMNLAPQVINALKLNQELVECEMCSRILYIEDEI